MDEIFKSENELLQGIIDKDGDCISAAWCVMCPFSDICVLQAISKAYLLPKEERVRKAYDRLFNDLMENELDESTKNDKD